MSEQYCSCSDWPELAKDPFFPIWFNSRMNEYVLIFGDLATSSLIIYYCPSCGGSLPKSKRGEFFTIPDNEELAEARLLLKQVTDSTSMRRTLGEPDYIFDWWTDESGNLVRNPDAPIFKRQYRYQSRWRTLQVTIQEMEDGVLKFSFSGKGKNNSDASA